MRVDLDVPGFPELLADQTQRAVYRVVQESLTNAVKHAPAAAVRVGVRCAADGVHVTVDNDGPPGGRNAGLPSSGHGLIGLSERVDLLGGEFSASPLPDGGFRDRGHPARGAAEVRAGGRCRGADAAHRGRGQFMIKVMIVDDNDIVRRGLHTIIDAAEDLRVVADAGGGRSAIEAARRARPDIALVDIRMPGMDGLTATRELLALDQPPHVIILTTFNTDEYVDEAIRSGAAGFLLKGSPPDELLRALRAVHSATRCSTRPSPARSSTRSPIRPRG